MSDQHKAWDRLARRVAKAYENWQGALEYEKSINLPEKDLAKTSGTVRAWGWFLDMIAEERPKHRK